MLFSSNPLYLSVKKEKGLRFDNLTNKTAGFVTRSFWYKKKLNK